MLIVVVDQRVPLAQGTLKHHRPRVVSVTVKLALHSYPQQPHPELFLVRDVLLDQIRQRLVLLNNTRVWIVCILLSHY